MTDNYARILKDNLGRLYADLPEDLAGYLPGTKSGDRFIFNAFGDCCEITPDGITLQGNAASSILGILISLYALSSSPDKCLLLPFKAYKEFPNAAPYIAAFTSHTEKPLVSSVRQIRAAIPGITQTLHGEEDRTEDGGDFSFIVYPFPKIALRYIFYEADEEFPASVTCLFSNNANRFLPMDGLADLGEYTSKKILELL